MTVRPGPPEKSCSPAPGPAPVPAPVETAAIVIAFMALPLTLFRRALAGRRLRALSCKSAYTFQIPTALNGSALHPLLLGHKVQVPGTSQMGIHICPPLQRTDYPVMCQAQLDEPASGEPLLTAAVCAFSLTSRITQRDGR